MYSNRPSGGMGGRKAGRLFEEPERRDSVKRYLGEIFGQDGGRGESELNVSNISYGERARRGWAHW
jgi:hypothetical protein